MRAPLAIIGGGRVGQTLGRLWRSRGWPVAAVTCRDPLHAAEAAEFIGTAGGVDNASAAAEADVLVVSTGDSDVAGAVEDLAAAGALEPRHIILHTSGALGLDVLEPARAHGAAVGSIHPIHSFAAPEPDGDRLKGCVWGVTADDRALDTARLLVEGAGGVAVPVDEADRPVYHAAAAIASNATVGVLHLAITLLESCGFADEQAKRALSGLARGTVDNIGVMGTVDALTGPIVRGDVATIEGHLEALATRDPRWRDEYAALGRMVLAVATERGSLDDATAARLARLLGAGDLT